MERGYGSQELRWRIGTRLLCNGGPNGSKLCLWIVELFERVRYAPVPVAGVVVITLDLVEDGVQPVGGRIAFKVLRRLVRCLPLAGDGEVDCLDQLLFCCCHFSQPFARKSQAGQWPHP